MKYPISNSVIITSKQNPNKFIAVHRKENPLLLCLPGGKLELNEDVLTGMARETYEETGLNIAIEKFQPIYVGLCEGVKEHWTTAYWVQIDEVEVLESPEPEMRPFWTTKEYFMKNTSFPIFNSQVFNALDKIK